MTSSSEISGAAERGAADSALALVSIAVLGLVTLGLLLALFVSVQGHQRQYRGACDRPRPARGVGPWRWRISARPSKGRLTDLQAADRRGGEAAQGAVRSRLKDLDRAKAERDAAIGDRQEADASGRRSPATRSKQPRPIWPDAAGIDARSLRARWRDLRAHH